MLCISSLALAALPFIHAASLDIAQPPVACFATVDEAPEPDCAALCKAVDDAKKEKEAAEKTAEDAKEKEEEAKDDYDAAEEDLKKKRDALDETNEYYDAAVLAHGKNSPEALEQLELVHLSAEDVKNAQSAATNAGRDWTAAKTLLAAAEEKLAEAAAKLAAAEAAKAEANCGNSLLQGARR